MRTAVVTLAINNPSQWGACWGDWVAAGLKSHHAYAKRIGAEAVEITKPVIGQVIMAEKWQLVGLLEVHDRILYLDADTFIDPEAPNVFDLVCERSVGAYDESHKNKDGLKFMEQSFNVKASSYFNTGVMVLSRCHAPLFKLSGLHCDRPLHEQTSFNFQLIRQGWPIHRLSAAWNCMAWSFDSTHEVYHHNGEVGVSEGRLLSDGTRSPWVWHFNGFSPEERFKRIEELNRKHGL